MLNLELVCAQSHPELIEECVELLNSEWPRSKTARIVSLQQGSADGLPTALLLIDGGKEVGKGRVVGHCKVSPVSAYDPSACFVESIVVAKCLRGKGLGRVIMERMEDYVKMKGIRTVYLTTHDQQGFYERLGYSLCQPIVVYGGVCKGLQGKLDMPRSGMTEEKQQIKSEGDTRNENSCDAGLDGNRNGNMYASASAVPPPPPPPPPSTDKRKLTKNDIVRLPLNNQVKVSMKKELW